jgi:UPF0716 protein FxsA
MRWFIFLLPWIELYSLIRLGSNIGAVATLGYVLLTLVVGMSILRWQGREVIARLRDAQMGWSIPPQLMKDDLALGIAGLLLAIPGLVTDSMAILVLIGPLFRRFFRILFGRVSSPPPRSPDTSEAEGSPGAPLEGEFRRLDDD